MKKRLPFILVIIIVVFSVAFIIYSLSNNKLQKSSYNDLNDNQTQSSTTENVEKEQKSEEEKEISSNNDISDVKQETSIKQENTVNNKNNSNNSNSSSNKNSSTIKDNNPSNPPIENKQEVVTPKEDVTPQVDPEYERLKSLIKYKDDMECYNASLDVSLEYLDDENFQVITCSSYAYNGQLLGYRMAVHYWDGTVVYLDAID